MIILGIDPAMNGPAGAALLDTGRDVPFRWLDVLTYRRNSPAEERYQDYSAWLADIWARHGGEIERCACEDSYLDQNVATTKALAQCVGIARAHAYARGCPFVLVNPSHTRRTLATLPPVLHLAAGHAAIAEADRDHAYCAAAISWKAFDEATRAALRRRAG